MHPVKNLKISNNHAPSTILLESL